MDTQVKDRADFIACYGEHVVEILGNPRTADYELFELGNGLPTPEQFANYSARGIAHHVGTFGLVLGEFRAHFYIQIPSAHAAALGRAYRELISLPPAPKANAGDGAGWLQALYGLKDPREAN
jgi:hypothetical protein